MLDAAHPINSHHVARILLADIAGVLESLYSERLTLAFPLDDLRSLYPHVSVVESPTVPRRPGAVSIERSEDHYVLRLALDDGSLVAWRRGDYPQAHAA